MKHRFTVVEYKLLVKEVDMPVGSSDKQIADEAKLLAHLYGWDRVVELKNENSLPSP